MRRANRLVLILGALMNLWAASAAAAPPPAHLDRGYGSDGIATLPGKKVKGRTYAGAVAVEPDGGIVLATNVTLSRLAPSGRVDHGFGDDGVVTPPAPAGGWIRIAGAAITPDGRIVVVATSHPPGPRSQPLPLKFEFGNGEPPYEPAHTEARIYRYLSDGRLDPTFGEGGIVETSFGLPIGEFEGVKLTSEPVVETTGVAVGREGRILITGAAPAGAFGGACYHDDTYAAVTYAAFVARLTATGGVDRSFGTEGVFGGRSADESPLKLEEAGFPAVTPDGEVIFQRGGWGGCARRAGGLGVVRLSPGGKVLHTDKPVGERRVHDAAVGPDGSTVLLLLPPKGEPEGPEVVEKLRPDGSPDRSFGKGGVATLPLRGESYANGLAVAADGEVLLQGGEIPGWSAEETRGAWQRRYLAMLIGLTARGAPDTRIGPNGVATRHVPAFAGADGIWLDGKGRATLVNGYRPAGSAIGLTAIRFVLPG